MTPIVDLPAVTGLALDESTHSLYVSQLDGQLAVVDVPTGVIRARREISGVGLAGIATANRRFVAINTPGQELLSIAFDSDEIARLPLDAPPAAVAVLPAHGAACVLEPAADAVVCIDVSSAAELGRVSLGDAQVEEPRLQPDLLWVRPRLTVAADGTLAFTGPAAGVIGRLLLPH
jgi:hypothetical protein